MLDTFAVVYSTEVKGEDLEGSFLMTSMIMIRRCFFPLPQVILQMWGITSSYANELIHSSWSFHASKPLHMNLTKLYCKTLSYCRMCKLGGSCLYTNNREEEEYAVHRAAQGMAAVAQGTLCRIQLGRYSNAIHYWGCEMKEDQFWALFSNKF